MHGHAFRRDPAHAPRMEIVMNAKKGVFVVIVLFIGFYMFKDPSGLASLASNGAGEGWALTTQFFEATIRFLNELF